MTRDPKEVVRRGYDVLSEHYEQAYDNAAAYRPWLAELTGRVPAGAAVVDIGCGAGSAAGTLVAAGCRVIGVDLSETQVRRARERVPDATFIHADATTVDFPAGSFDAVVSFYSATPRRLRVAAVLMVRFASSAHCALIHIPLAEQPPLLTRIAGWLRPGGWFVGTTGHTAWTGTDEDWLGGGTPMWWSHADAATYRSWLTDAGLEVTEEEFVPEGAGGHALFWARRP